ncbi:MAG: PD-(D/E)XK nuclease family protein [Pseudomonadota bacterium]
MALSADTLWDKPDGRAMAALLDGLAAAASVEDPGLPGQAYPALVDTLARARTARPDPRTPHPRVAIWGTIEARVAAADLTILAGLAEGGWPATADTGPWLNRPMRATLGLPSPEREIGLSAHDFLQAACRPDVVLTRAETVAGTPQVPARWLVRLTTLLQGTAPQALAAMRARGRAWLDLVPTLAEHPPLPRAPRPCPAPPLALRPRRLSATGLERLIRDPYAVYARYVLGLCPLDPLGAAPDARDRGEILHAVMHRFVAETRAGLPASEDAVARLMAIADALLPALCPRPDLRRLWRGRLERAAPALVAREAALRALARPAAAEIEGTLTLALAGGPFTLTARIDRVDTAAGGGARLYDYKAAQVPSDKQVGTFQHQVTLAALMAADGGIEALPMAWPEGGGYLSLSSERTTDLAVAFTTAAGLEAYRADLVRTLAPYDDPAHGYLSWRAMHSVDDMGDYDHLARRAEWAGP